MADWDTVQSSQNTSMDPGSRRDQDKQEVVILKNMLLHQIRSRAALRETNQQLREIWVNPYTSANMETLDLARISQTPEIRKAFPREIAETAGYL